MKLKPTLFALALVAGLALAGCGSDKKDAAAPAAASDAATAVAPAPAAPPATALPPPPQLNARSFIVIDHESGRVLAALEPDSRQEPASLTKLMTAYVVFQALKEGRIKLTDMVTVSENAWRQATPKLGGSAMFIEVGKQVSVENLIQGMIVQSGNDATVALAENVGGHRGHVRADDEHLRQAARHDGHALHECGGHARPRAVHHGARRGDARERADPRVPGVLQAGTRRRSSPGTASRSRTATACCGATRRSTASRPATPRPRATAWSLRPSATACAWSPSCSARIRCAPAKTRAPRC